MQECSSASGFRKAPASALAGITLPPVVLLLEVLWFVFVLCHSASSYANTVSNNSFFHNNSF
jgi:hypothetical protein